MPPLTQPEKNMDAFNASVQPGQAAFSASQNDTMIAVFHRGHKHMPAESEATGRPVFKGIDYVTLSNPGEKDNIIEEVHELHKLQYARQWDAYQKGMEQVVSGTPLIELFPGFPEVIQQLRMINVHTIEGLMKTPDSTATATQVPFLSEWKKRAQAWSERQSSSELQRSLDAERAARKALEDRLAALEANVAPTSKLNLAPVKEDA